MTANPTQPQPNWQPPHVPAPPAPEPPRKSWFARHKIITGLLALVLVAVVAQAVNGPDSTAPASGTAPATAFPAAGANDESDQPGNQPNDQPAREATVGTPVRDGQFEFTVTKVEKGVAKLGDQYLNEKAQGQFVLVHVTVENIGDSAQLLDDSSQKVRDAKGREFSADTAAAIYIKDNEVFLNEVNPGNTVKGVLVFDMPKGATPTSIELHDSPFSGGATVRLS